MGTVLYISSFTQRMYCQTKWTSWFELIHTFECQWKQFLINVYLSIFWYQTTFFTRIEQNCMHEKLNDFAVQVLLLFDKRLFSSVIHHLSKQINSTHPSSLR